MEMACALRQVLAARTDLQGIVALSPNPALRQAVMEVLADEERVTLTEPLSPEIFHNLLARCALVMTDSGGIQEEAVFLGKPTLVMRQKTERQEGLNGSVILVGQRREEIVREALSLLSDGERYARLAKPSHVFGDGFASRRIADTLLAHA